MGLLASRGAILIYTAVIAAVVATTGAAGTRPLAAVVVETSARLIVGTVIALSVVWRFETARAQWSARRGRTGGPADP